MADNIDGAVLCTLWVVFNEHSGWTRLWEKIPHTNDELCQCSSEMRNSCSQSSCRAWKGLRRVLVTLSIVGRDPYALALNNITAIIIIPAVMRVTKTDGAGIADPYRANMSAIKARFSQNGLLRDVEVSILNSYQGREAHVITINLVANQDSEPGFNPDLGTGITRQQCELFIFGNVDTAQRTGIQYWTTLLRMFGNGTGGPKEKFGY
ncbi:hypothetical protein EDB81DRAFT_932817 [Dactylonectria macrodidyma]|uniref:DNA2/NAM7 helicase-like C-terminal domain-containing protein n=1 Tax=Dactylonectria macrodidyma TaxID=307937 RepID=A0A9P9EXM1_9HYPO|nr:hypothetical protein EDB81DRAFT_932817 [Dactylonectria macrodidyma]